MEAVSMSQDMTMIQMAFLFAILLSVLIFMYFFAKAMKRSGEKKAEKAAEILKIYAERGQEPPQELSDAVITLAGGWPRPKATPALPRQETRGRHLADFARDIVVAAGAAGIAWWRSPGPGEHPGTVMTLGIVVALIFTAGAVWHLVTALQMRDGQ
jgi:hypothetical protein